jgi:hypothetical protein
MGMERGEGRISPNSSKIPTGTKDPGLPFRKRITLRCNGYTDPRDGSHKVSPDHTSTYVSFSQDAAQTQNRCPGCQRDFRSAYKQYHKMKKARRSL